MVMPLKSRLEGQMGASGAWCPSASRISWRALRTSAMLLTVVLDAIPSFLLRVTCASIVLLILLSILLLIAISTSSVSSMHLFFLFSNHRPIETLDDGDGGGREGGQTISWWPPQSFFAFLRGTFFFRHPSRPFGSLLMALVFPCRRATLPRSMSDEKKRGKTQSAPR